MSILLVVSNNLKNWQKWIFEFNDVSFVFDLKDILCIDDAAVFNDCNDILLMKLWNFYSLKVYIRYLHSLIYIISIFDLHHVCYNFYFAKVRDRHSKFVNCKYEGRRLSSTVRYIMSSEEVSNRLSWSDPF